MFRWFVFSIREFHQEVVYNVLTFRNILDWRSLPALVGCFWLALSLSELLFTVFVIFYLLDYLTGIFASIVELRKNPLKLERRRKRKGKMYWIESGKLIRGLVKMLVYLQLILAVVVLTYILDLEHIVLHERIIPLTPSDIFLSLILQYNALVLIAVARYKIDKKQYVICDLIYVRVLPHKLSTSGFSVIVLSLP